MAQGITMDRESAFDARWLDALDALPQPLCPDRLFVSDLDGTLLQMGGVLSPLARDALGALLDRGLCFTVASARSVHSISPIMAGVPITLPVIEFNGAFLSHLQTGEHLWMHAFSAELVEGFLAMAEEHQLVPFLSTHDGKEDRLYIESLPNANAAAYYEERRAAGDNRLQPLGGLAEARRQSVVCFTLIAPVPALEAFELAINTAFPDEVTSHLYREQFSNEDGWLTFHQATVSKAAGVAALQELDPFRETLQGRRVVAFGDQLNDFEMLREADEGLAMGNAHPDLKPVARRIIEPNTQEGVIRELLRQCGLSV